MGHDHPHDRTTRVLRSKYDISVVVRHRRDNIRSRRDRQSAFEAFQAAVVSALIIGAASGGIVLAAGAGPAEPLHLVYATIAVAAIPAARSFAGRGGPRAQQIAVAAAFAVLGFMVYRLFATG